MPLNIFGKILFPHQAHWQRKKNMKTTLWVVLASLMFGFLVVVVMQFINGKR